VPSLSRSPSTSSRFAQSRSRARSSSSSSGDNSQQRRARKQQRHKEKKEGLIKGSAGLLLGIGVAAVVAHKFWPKGILYGGKEEWEAEVKEKIVQRRRPRSGEGRRFAGPGTDEDERDRRRGRGRSRDGYGYGYDRGDEYRPRRLRSRGGRVYYYDDVDEEAQAHARGPRDGRLAPDRGPGPGGGDDVRRTRSTTRPIFRPRTPSEERWRREDEPLQRAREARNGERMRRRVQAGYSSDGPYPPPPPPPPGVVIPPPPPAGSSSSAGYAQERYYRRDGSIAHPDEPVYVVERTPW